MSNRSTRSNSVPSLASLFELENGNQNKRSRKELNKDSVPTMSLEDLWTKIESKMDSFKQDFDKRIDGLETQLSQLKTECTARIDDLSEAVVEVRADLNLASNWIGRVEKYQDLIITGVPYSPTENLKTVFRDIAAKLAYDPLDVPMVDLKRLAKPPIAAGSAPPILCQFAIRNERNAFYSKYLSLRNLNLEHIGFNNKNRIFINENLTPQDREIRTAAIKLKKEGRIQQVFSRDGVVHVKSRGGPAEACYTVEHLRSCSK